MTKQCLKCGRHDPKVDEEGRCARQPFLSKRRVQVQSIPTCGGRVISIPIPLGHQQRQNLARTLFRLES